MTGRKAILAFFHGHKAFVCTPAKRLCRLHIMKGGISFRPAHCVRHGICQASVPGGGREPAAPHRCKRSASVLLPLAMSGAFILSSVASSVCPSQAAAAT